MDQCARTRVIAVKTLEGVLALEAAGVGLDFAILFERGAGPAAEGVRH